MAKLLFTSLTVLKLSVIVVVVVGASTEKNNFVLTSHLSLGFFDILFELLYETSLPRKKKHKSRSNLSILKVGQSKWCDTLKKKAVETSM
jgi:hypothetical protein